jgi:hypothetical protein
MCIASGEAFSPSHSRHEHENSQFAGNMSRLKVKDASGVAYCCVISVPLEIGLMARMIIMSPMKERAQLGAQE